MSRSETLTGLIKWAARPEWRDRFAEVLDEHIGDACERWDVDEAGLYEMVGEAWASALWGCVSEDFLTRFWDEDDANIVDDYLKRRGWKESPTDKRYMTALRDSFMSIYEIRSVVVGESFVAQDLILGGEPVRVTERSATRALESGHRIAARIVDIAGRQTMSGGVLLFPAGSADALVEELNGDLATFREGVEEQRVAAGEKELSEDEEEMLVQFWLHDVAPLVTTVWFEQMLPQTGDAQAK